MNRREYFLGIWKVLIFAVVRFAVFLFLVPYWLKRFDVYMSWPAFDLGVFRYSGAAVFLVAASFSLYSIYFLAVRAGGLPVNPVRGTAPSRLVVAGPYSYLRNPQQLGAILMLAGLAIYFESLSISIYTVIVAAYNHMYVILVEEPGLRRKFGIEYEDYCRRVSRWLPKIW